MSAFLIFAIMAAIVIILAMVWTSFRRWLGRQFALIAALIGRFLPAAFAWITRALGVIARYIGIYSFILSVTVVGALILMGIFILIGSPGLTGFIFVFCLGLILLAWLPAGLIMRLFRVTDGVVPCWLKSVIGVTAFIGFVGVVLPEVMTFITMVSLALIGFIFAAGTRKTNVIDKIIIPLTILMIAVITWKYVSPEGFRSSTRYIASWSKVFNTTKDRGSINNETEAATTYAIALKDISVLYEIDDKGKVELVDEEIAEGDTLRLVSHRDEVIIVEGQGLLKIQLRNDKGTFINGPKYWVEAEFVQIASPREVVTKKDRADSVDKGSEEIEIVESANKVGWNDFDRLPSGEYIFELQAGEETPWFGFEDGRRYQYSIGSPTFDYKVKVSDGSEYSGHDRNIAVKKNAFFKIIANTYQIITIKVNYL